MAALWLLEKYIIKFTFKKILLSNVNSIFNTDTMKETSLYYVALSRNASTIILDRLILAGNNLATSVTY